MKYKILKKCFSVILLFLTISTVLPAEPTTRKPIYMNFLKLVLRHSKDTNEYHLAVIAIDDSARGCMLDL
ncbi:MAG: hypothetical protein GY757_08965, partial [bacterium]|nr:hypothetical protein [bacterium]